MLGTPAVSYQHGRCDVFAIGGDGGTFNQHRTDGGNWVGWSSMAGGNLTGGLDSLIGANGENHVFCVTTWGALFQYVGSSTAGWIIQDISNSGTLVGAPAGIYRGGRYDVFGIGLDRALWQQTFVNGLPTWGPWTRIGGSGLVSGVDAIADSNGGYRVVGIDADGQVQQFTSPDGATWTHTDISNNGTLMGTPAVTRVSGRVDVFGIGLDRRVWQQTR